MLTFFFPNRWYKRGSLSMAIYERNIFGRIRFLAVFRKEITTILTPLTSEGGKWGEVGVVMRYGFFCENNLKTVFGTLFPPQKKSYIHFRRPIPVPPKMVTLLKNNFSFLIRKILFFPKKLLNEKYSKRRCLQKRLYWFLSPDASRFSKRSSAPPPQKRLFRSFLQKYCFFRKTCFIIKHPLLFIIIIIIIKA